MALFPHKPTAIELPEDMSIPPFEPQVREGRLDHATATLARAWEAAPDDPAILTAYGLALLEVGQGDRARTLTREALDRRPDHPGLTALLRTLDNTRND